MGDSGGHSRIYSFYRTVVAVLGFAILFYLLIVCFTGTYRLISDIGDVRVLFLNPVLILSASVIIVLAAGSFILRSSKITAVLERFNETGNFRSAMRITKILIFAECLIFAAGANGMSQAVDQLSVQQASYGLSWGESGAIDPSGYLGIYPNNLGMTVILYLTSFVTGHYNNLFLMIVFASLVPFIYSDLAEIGGKFGLSHKSRLLIMICGILFCPLAAKTLIIYGDIPGLFLSVRAMKHAISIASGKTGIKSTLIVTIFPAIACVFKNNYIIFAIAIILYLSAEMLRQKRFTGLFIPFTVLILSFLLNPCISMCISAIIGKNISSGASKLSWIAMGMQEESGMYNGYNAVTYMQSGFDTSVQAQMAKESIAESIDRFISDPSYAISFYTRKAMAMWSDPTHCSLEFYSRNVYLNSEQSPLIWFLANPLIIRVIASFLKLFQVLIFLGSAVFAVSTGRKKEGSPAILLFLTFCGGYVFHIIWEAEPFYTLAYMVLLIPAGVAGIVALIKKITSINIKELSGKRFKIGSGAVYFIAGTAVFLFAVAGLGTIRTQLADGRSEYRDYFENDLNNSRNPAEPGIYNLIPASDDYKGNGIKVELIRYAGKYRIRLAETDQDMNAYLTYDDGRIRADWFSSDDKQEFTILKNRNGSYSICHGANKAMSQDPSKGGMVPGDFINYAFSFNTDPYDQFISEHPEMTWNLIP